MRHDNSMNKTGIKTEMPVFPCIIHENLINKM